MKTLNENLRPYREKDPVEKLAIEKIKIMLLDSFSFNTGNPSENLQVLESKAKTWIDSNGLDFWAEQAGTTGGYIRKLHSILTQRYVYDKMESKDIKMAINKLEYKL